MAVDMATLKAVTFGDPESSLTVKRKWLGEVYKLLVEGAQAKADLAHLKAKVAEHNKMLEAHNAGLRRPSDRDMDEGFAQMDEGMGKIFGEGGAFDTIFGKGRKRR